MFYQFLKDVWADTRFPSRDKKTLIIIVILIISPIDLIPEWIPFFGMLDDVMMIGLFFDYFVNRLGDEILLSHYPYGMISYARIRRFARIMANLAPQRLARLIWKKAISLD